MSQISAKVVGDSVSSLSGDRISTLVLTFPRFLLAELNTHRVFSKNSASSRAIPVHKMIEAVKNNSFIPIAWQKEHKGMQGSEYFTEEKDIEYLKDMWFSARDFVVQQAKSLTLSEAFIDGRGLTKQLANRLLEPFMWHTVIITGTEWENFFNLRCPRYEFEVPGTGRTEVFKSKLEAKEKYPVLRNFTEEEWRAANQGQAEIHMMELAEKIYDAIRLSQPVELKPGEWHIPFGDHIDNHPLSGPLASYIHKYGSGLYGKGTGKYESDINMVSQDPANREYLRIKISTGMSARASYTVVGDEKEVSYETLVGIHDKMINANPFHASPFEHCARVMTKDEYYSHIMGVVDTEMIDDELHIYNQCTSQDMRDSKYGWCRNYRGFIQYRDLLENNKTI